MPRGTNDHILDTLNCTEGQIAIQGANGWECKEFSSVLDNDNDGVLQWNDCDDTNANVDFIWENTTLSPASQITEVLEHILHTITTFGLPGAYPNVFGSLSHHRHHSARQAS